jgi:hypothetical protein
MLCVSSDFQFVCLNYPEEQFAVMMLPALEKGQLAVVADEAVLNVPSAAPSGIASSEKSSFSMVNKSIVGVICRSIAFIPLC